VFFVKDGLGRNKEEMDKFCAEHGFAGWFETSAKDNVGIDKVEKVFFLFFRALFFWFLC
jgi:hypothetical protein